MNIENCIIHLIGFPGVGKLTIAREVAAISDFRLIDNHAINNLVFTTIPVDGKAKLPQRIWDSTRAIRDIIFETIRALSPQNFNFIFTNFIADDDDEDREQIQKFIRLAKDRGSLYIPIYLICDPEEHKKRVISPERKLNMKQTDADVLTQLLETSQLIKIDTPHQFSIDVTHLKPSETAAFILQRVQDLVLQSKSQSNREPCA